MRTILFTLILMLSVACLQAQDKYEYANVKSSSASVFFTSSKGTEETKLEKGSKGIDSEALLLKKVEELNEQGWEVYNVTEVQQTSYTFPTRTFYLRKKKN